MFICLLYLLYIYLSILCISISFFIIFRTFPSRLLIRLFLREMAPPRTKRLCLAILLLSRYVNHEPKREPSLNHFIVSSIFISSFIYFIFFTSYDDSRERKKYPIQPLCNVSVTRGRIVTQYCFARRSCHLVSQECLPPLVPRGTWERFCKMVYAVRR